MSINKIDKIKRLKNLYYENFNFYFKKNIIKLIIINIQNNILMFLFWVCLFIFSSSIYRLIFFIEIDFANINFISKLLIIIFYFFLSLLCWYIYYILVKDIIINSEETLNYINKKLDKNNIFKICNTNEYLMFLSETSKNYTNDFNNSLDTMYDIFFNYEEETIINLINRLNIIQKGFNEIKNKN